MHLREKIKADAQWSHQYLYQLDEEDAFESPSFPTRLQQCREDICTDFCIKILNKTNYWTDRQQTASQGHNHFGQRWPGNNCCSRKNKRCELIRVCKIFQRPNNSKGNSSNQYLHQPNDCCMMTTCSSEQKFLIKPWLLSCKKYSQLLLLTDQMSETELHLSHKQP